MAISAFDDNLDVAAELDLDAATAIELLSDDHEELRQLLDAYDMLVDEHASSTDCETMARVICALWTVHATIEQEIFYPAARAALGDGALIDQFLTRHVDARLLTAEIEASSAGDPGYDNRVRLLGDAIRQHAIDEENTLFVDAAAADLDLQDLGRQLADRREQLMADLALDA